MALLALQRSVKALLERLEKISKESLTKRASRSASHKSWWRAENIFSLYSRTQSRLRANADIAEAGQEIAVKRMSLPEEINFKSFLLQSLRTATRSTQDLLAR